MKTIEFKTEIDSNVKKVWDTMFDPETYKEWVNVSWPGSYYEGNWKQGEDMRFIAPGMGGTLATLTEVRPYEFIMAKHVAVINPDGTEDRDSETAKGWVGSTESYSFSEKNGKTKLKVQIHTNPEWEKMFSDGWPKALDKLKEICESHVHV